MTILYSLIARNKTVLAEYTCTSGNFPTITRVLLGKIADEDAKMSYVYDQHVFHYIVDNHIVYMCMCDDTNKRRIPFAFLEDMQQRFKATYGDKAQTAIAFAMNDDFGRTLQRQMEFYNGPSADNFATVSNKLDDVKSIMVQNIDLVLERGEKLELLVDKTEQLQQQAFKFQRSSKQLKVAMIWRRIKLYLLIFVVVVLICWIISAIICGIDYAKCQTSTGAPASSQR